MAAIRDTPKTYSIINDRDFLKQIQSSDTPHFREPVKKGSYPHSGFDHPILAVGDCIEFVTKKGGLKLFNKATVFEIIGIRLGRLPKSLDWDWIIEVKQRG